MEGGSLRGFGGNNCRFGGSIGINIDFDLSSLQWGNGGTVNPLNSAEYPEKASYTVDMLSTEETNFIKKPSEVNGSYDSYNLCYYLEQNSDLIVYGTFTDDSHHLHTLWKQPFFLSPKAI